ncbi:hypothetical protein D9M68_138700 [compost metagenome]
MLVHIIPSYAPNKFEQPLARQGYLAMECPRCGYTQFTGVAAVARFFGRKIPEAFDE